MAESGAGISSAQQHEDILATRYTTAASTDTQLQTLLDTARTTATRHAQRLDTIEKAINETVARQSSIALDTSAGARQFQRFLATKHREILGVLDEAQQANSHLQTQAQTLRYALPEMHVNPKPPPPPAQPEAPVCYIGTEGGNITALCPPDTDTVSYVDKDGNYVFKDLHTGEVTIHMRPGPVDGNEQVCWLPTAAANRSICGPGTTSWMYPRDGFLITEEQGPDGKTHIKFQTPQGPLIP
jgi:hypothetical protein